MLAKVHEQITRSKPLLRRKGLVLTSTCRGGNQPFWTHSFLGPQATFRGHPRAIMTVAGSVKCIFHILPEYIVRFPTVGQRAVQQYTTKRG